MTGLNKNIASYWTSFFRPAINKTDFESVLSSMPPFSKLSPKYLKLLLKIVHYRDYEIGECIFYQGDPGVGLFIVKEGAVKIVLEYENEESRELAHFEPGNFFGDMALLDETARSATAIATSKTKLAVIFKADLDEFIDQFPAQGVNILRGLSQIIASRLRILNKDYTEIYNIARKKNEEQKNELNQEDISTS